MTPVLGEGCVFTHYALLPYTFYKREKDKELLKMNEENTNWDKELEELNSVDWQDQTGMSPEEARFEIVIRKLEAVMSEWGATEVYADIPEDVDLGSDWNAVEVKIDAEPFEDSFKTTLGDVASVPILGVIANILAEILDNSGAPKEDALREYRSRVVNAVQALMIEGILVSKSPAWNDRFQEVTDQLS